MENCILMEITGAAIWANITGWISRQILAVSGFARIGKNEVKSVMNFLRKANSSNIPAVIIRKPLQALGLSNSEIKKQGVFEKIHTG